MPTIKKKDDYYFEDYDVFKKKALKKMKDNYRIGKPGDYSLLWMHEGKCMSCGNPEMTASPNPYMCARCEKTRLGDEEFEKRLKIVQHFSTLSLEDIKKQLAHSYKSTRT